MYHPQNHNREPKRYYEKAKEFETKDRNLKMALKYYAKSAQNGEKVESSIKDFASVLHQCGKTAEAVNFLERFRSLTAGGDKYENLLQNLKKQLKPTGKVLCKRILLTNIDADMTEKEIYDMFENSSRIQEIYFSSYLHFVKEINPLLKKKYCLVCFESFSAAKKTVETFKFA